jgi:lactate permease
MAERPAGERVERAPVMSLPMAFLPYVLLTVVTLSAVLITPLNDLLSEWQLGLSFPAVATGFGIEHGAVDSYAPIRPLSHPGAMLLITAFIVWIVYRAGGYYRAWGQRETPQRIGSALLIDAVPASLPVIAFLVTSRTLDHSGQILTIAHGIAEVSPAMVYAGIASTIGALGAFMTSSSTASNVLFAGVQAEVAHAHDLRTETIIAAQAAGSTYGNAIAPANIVLGTSVCGIKGQEGAVLRLTLPWTVLVAILTGLATIALLLLD